MGVLGRGEASISPSQIPHRNGGPGERGGERFSIPISQQKWGVWGSSIPNFLTEMGILGGGDEGGGVSTPISLQKWGSLKGGGGRGAGGVRIWGSWGVSIPIPSQKWGFWEGGEGGGQGYGGPGGSLSQFPPRNGALRRGGGEGMLTKGGYRTLRCRRRGLGVPLGFGGMSKVK